MEQLEWVKRWDEALAYLEAHLTEEIDYERAAQIACCSVYHFQRMFAYLAGVPLSEYLRRRRMTLAAVDLQAMPESRIVDIALKWGYASPTAFNRAFQSVHGVAPSAVRGGGVSVKSFAPIRFHITIKGAEAMDYRIEKREAFRVVGISRPLEREIEKNFETVPSLWQQAAMNGTIAALAAKMDGELKGLMGISACGAQEEWRYYIAVASTAPAEGFEEYVVPAADWAVFSGRGTSQSIQKLEQRIVTQWLPASGYEYADGPDVELYLSPDPQNAVYEVWIPVTKRREN